MIGIYSLVFTGTDRVYIGQSNNILSRYTAHRTSLIAGTASKKLLEAYRLYGIPTLEVLLECSLEELNDLEEMFIIEYASVENGFNTVSYKTGQYTSMCGEVSGMAIYTNDVYKEILKELATTNLFYPEIAKKLNVTATVVRYIGSLKGHRWLKIASHDYYKLLEDKHAGGYRESKNTGKFPDITSPEGVVYTVNNISAFAKEHGLHASNLNRVLHNLQPFHKGWRLATPTIKIKEFVLVHESGTIKRNLVCTKLAKECGLSRRQAQKVHSGEQISALGWMNSANAIIRGIL